MKIIEAWHISSFIEESFNENLEFALSEIQSTDLVGEVIDIKYTVNIDKDGDILRDALIIYKYEAASQITE